jgi:transcriptional regulator with XRE-family HTH domain
MDQIKLGRFIAERTKAVYLTQAQLAEMLGCTNRAVSKWETGNSLPDSSIMLDLCAVLKISVNDLLCGEVVSMDNYNKEMENRLIEMVKEKEESDRRLLRMEVVAGVVSLLPLIPATIIANMLSVEEWVQGMIVLASLVPFLIIMPFLLKIEQTAGYYQCRKCGHKHVPKYKSVFWAMHAGRTRYMKCPKCGEKSWQKKVISKE